jgi:hypothetical protein
MTATPEGKVKSDIRSALECLGIYSLAYLYEHPDIVPSGFYMLPVQTGMSIRGVSDFILCVRGDFCVIEAKRPKKARTTVHQTDFMSIVEKTGGKATVAKSGAEVTAWLTKHFGGLGTLGEMISSSTPGS